MSKCAVWRADEVYITFDARHESRQDRPPKATFTLSSNATLYALAQKLFDGWLGRVLNEDIDDHLWFFDRGCFGSAFRQENSSCLACKFWGEA